MATLLANDQIPSGIWDEAGELLIMINNRPAQIARSESRVIDGNREIVPPSKRRGTAIRKSRQ